MKAESKAIIFGRYLGCNVLCPESTIPVKLEGVYINSTPVLFDVEKDYNYYELSLLLKPLSSISDEDAIEVGKLTYLNDPKTLRDDSYITWVNHELRNMDRYRINDKVFQFLCLKGYATPQTVIEDRKVVTYSVEELVNEGVFKF